MKIRKGTRIWAVRSKEWVELRTCRVQPKLIRSEAETWIEDEVPVYAVQPAYSIGPVMIPKYNYVAHYKKAKRKLIIIASHYEGGKTIKVMPYTKFVRLACKLRRDSIIEIPIDLAERMLNERP